MTSDKKEKVNSWFHSCFVGAGCGCIYPLFAIIIVFGISWYLFVDTQRLIRKPIDLNIASSRQEDFWKLQEKRMSMSDANSTDTIELSPSEFNAYLSSFSFKPYSGFFLDKMQFLPETNKGTLFLIGSGLFMRSFIITVELSFKGKSKVVSVMLNCWKVPENSLVLTKVLNFIFKLYTSNNYNLTYISKQSAFMKVSKTAVVIPKSLALFKRTADK